jgi:hypothetical protein
MLIYKQQTIVLGCKISLHRFLITEHLVCLLTNSYVVCSSMYSLHEYNIIKKVVLNSRGININFPIK